VEVVLKNHGTLRWEKLARLAPCHEFRLPGNSGERLVRVEYQEILDAQGGLIRIMALIQDVTEAKRLEARIKEEKIHLENKVKTILGITSNPPEVVAEFLKDSAAKISSLQQRLGRLDPAYDGAGHRKKGMEQEDAEAWVRAAYKDCHTIKGNAGAFGFDTLMEIAHDLECRLDDLNRGETTWSWSFPAIAGLVEGMREESARMREIHLTLTGNSEESYIRLPERKILKIRSLAEKTQAHALDPDLLTLVEYCKRISYRGLFSLTRKYQELVARVAAKLGKEVEFSVNPRELELDPELLFRADEALVHLLRNAVVHGIEENRSAAFLRKGAGRVELSYSRSYGGHEFSVRDNGRGIDPEALAERAVASGVLSRETAMGLGEKEKLQLIFYPGFSTSEKPDALSGRGMGMAIARESLAASGGTLALETRIGEGTVFTISLPA
jgi:chemotaxis protein histidine kinase CheA